VIENHLNGRSAWVRVRVVVRSETLDKTEA
jgi:hypothetical protein